MYLVDTNVWLERFLDQKKSQEVGQFLDRISSEDLFITGDVGGDAEVEATQATSD
ncbi:MAG: hypothetical protein AB1630_12805 [bacterium]